eukprot:3395276-Alexandrium_andersonii.AAC.1
MGSSWSAAERGMARAVCVLGGDAAPSSTRQRTFWGLLQATGRAARGSVEALVTVRKALQPRRPRGTTCL